MTSHHKTAAGFTLDPHSPTLNENDLGILGGVNTSIEQGQDLKAWWKANRDTRVHNASFPVARQIHRPDENYGFLMNANLRKGQLPVAGVIQDQIFDFPKAPPHLCDDAYDHTWMRSQLRTFIMKYFMKVTSSSPPSKPPHYSRMGKDTSLSSPAVSPVSGWGYQQSYYKLKATGEVGKFPDAHSTDLIALDEIGVKYDWVVFKINIYQFDFPLDLTGSANGAKVLISLRQPVHAVMTPDFLIDRENPEPGVLAEYGYGYSVVPDPNYKSVFAAGPSSISNTIETLTFRVLDTGEVRAHMDFITPQPAKIVNFSPEQLSFSLADSVTFGLASKVFAPLKNFLHEVEPEIDPVYMGVRLANILTLGLASDEFSVNNEQLFKTLMTLHFTDVFHMFTRTGNHYGMVRDWTDTEHLPLWAKHGLYKADTPV